MSKRRQRFELPRFIARCMLDADPLVQFAPPPSAHRPHGPVLARQLTHSEVERAFGKTYRLVSYNSGPIEIYRIHADGTETFLGYARDLLRNLNRGIAR